MAIRVEELSLGDLAGRNAVFQPAIDFHRLGASAGLQPKRFEALLDEIVVFGLFVQRNGAAVGRGFLLLAHRRVSIPVVSYAVSADFAGGGLSCLRRFDLVVIG